MEIKLKPTLKLVLKELGIAAVLATVSWLFLAGNFGTVFVLTLLIRYYMKNNSEERVIVAKQTPAGTEAEDRD